MQTSHTRTHAHAHVRTYAHNTPPLHRAGTYFWHDHASLNRADGLQGPLIVRAPPRTPGLYATPARSSTLFLSDWWHQTGNALAMRLNRCVRRHHANCCQLLSKHYLCVAAGVSDAGATSVTLPPPLLLPPPRLLPLLLPLLPLHPSHFTAGPSLLRRRPMRQAPGAGWACQRRCSSTVRAGRWALDALALLFGAALSAAAAAASHCACSRAHACCPQWCSAWRCAKERMQLPCSAAVTTDRRCCC